MNDAVGNRYAPHIYSKDFAELRSLLKARQSARDFSEAPSALGSAASSNLSEAVEVFLEEGVDLNAWDISGMTPLHWAVDRGRTEMVKRLVAAGAGVNVPDCQDMTPLHFAAFNARLDLVRFLVEAGADVTARNCEGKTPLDLARLKRFSLGSGGGVVTRLWDGPVARYLRAIEPRRRP